MDPEERPPINFDFNHMPLLIEEALEVIGKNWFDRRLKNELQAREAAQKRGQRKHRISYTAKHPFVRWYVEYVNWRDAFALDNDIPLNQSALLLATFVSNLVKVKNAAGLEGILRKLRNSDEFLATAFEVEVASGYVNKNWNVEFVETGVERSPDLKVTTDTGKVFWAECKCRDEMTGRDAEILKFWEHLQDKLYRVLAPAKINVALVVRSTCDPIFSELHGVADAILQASQVIVKHSERNRLEMRGKSRDEKYEFNLLYLADPDHEQPVGVFSDMGADWFAWYGEFRHDGNGNTFVRNPIFFGFTNMTPTDRYVGALNSFGSAVGQLPDSGPGVIWIRIPCPMGEARAQTELEKMATRLEKELSGPHNTRVNCVILSARFFSTEPNEGRPALTYRHVSTVITHKNPRSSM